MRNLAWVGAQTGGFAPQSMGMLNTIEYVELKKMVFVGVIPWDIVEMKCDI